MLHQIRFCIKKGKKGKLKLLIAFLNFVLLMSDHQFLAYLNNIQEELLYYPGLGVAAVAVSANVKVFRISLFPNPMMNLVHV